MSEWWQSGWWAVGTLVLGVVLGAPASRAYDKWATRKEEARAARMERTSERFREQVHRAASEEHVYVLMLGQALTGLFHRLGVMILSILAAILGLVLFMLIMLGDRGSGNPILDQAISLFGLALVGGPIITFYRLSIAARNFFNVSSRAKVQLGRTSDASTLVSGEQSAESTR